MSRTSKAVQPMATVGVKETENLCSKEFLLRHHGPIESLIGIRRRRGAEIHRGIGANEIRKRRPVDQIAGRGIDATDTLEL